MAIDARSLVQGWLVLSVLHALGNCLQCLDIPVLAEKLYEIQGKEQVTALYGRLFAQWHLLFGIIRLLNVAYFELKPLHYLSITTFLATIAHFALEAVLYKTTKPTNIGVLANILISAFSLILIGLSWPYLWKEVDNRPQTRKDRDKRVFEENKQLLFGKGGMFAAATTASIGKKTN